MLENWTDALINSFVGIAGQVETGQLASEAIALEVTAVLVAQGAFAPWARTPVDTLGGAAVPAPINVGLGQDLEQSGGLGGLDVARGGLFGRSGRSNRGNDRG